MKYLGIATDLTQSIKDKYGQEKVEELRKLCEVETNEGLARESICQILAHLPRWSRLKFLALYPELIVSYALRIKRK